MRKNYNYTRGKLHLPEYGRHIQEMVESLKGIEDRAERNKQAHAVIAVMGNLNPLLRDTADFTHKLWDHLYIISGFDLDVDSPYPIPTREEVEAKPKRMEYSRRNIPFKHYGRNVAKMIQVLAEEKDPEAVARTIDNIARYMRTKSFEYNQEHPNNEIIIKDIRKMAKEEIVIDEEAINNLRSCYKNNQTTHSAKGPKGQKMTRGGGGERNTTNQHSSNKHQNRNFSKGNNGQMRRNNTNNRQTTQN